MVEMEGTEVEGLISSLETWFFNDILILDNLISFLVFLLLIALTFFLKKKLLMQGERVLQFLPERLFETAKEFWEEIYLAFTLAFLVGLFNILAAILELPAAITYIAGYLLAAWLIIKFITWFLPDTILVQIIYYLVWIVAALNILGIYDMVINFLEGIELNLGELQLSVMLVIRGTLVFALLFWIASWFEKYLRKNLDQSDNLTPSVRVLLQKILRMLVYIVAFFIGLTSVGIDLGAFAFIGGAIGVGLGFGLQKIVSNFISGIIIILDKSIKPGDVVEIDEVFGEVRSLNSRFVSVVTRSGKEFLIPNEHFITNRVINWSYSNDLVRIDLDLGVGYNSNLNQVRELVLQAAEENSRILKRPKPVCLVKDFGDNTVDFQLRFWIKDPENGVDNIKSEVMYEVWDLFHEHDINIAFPQRDLHMSSISSDAAKTMKEIWSKDE
ncbi:mechanosensitive ion channel family protein [Halarsenatibacter silvermanii]|uniref:Mechanosensitive ion channel n=1 Tax=Halarsenatibacter silvermanii TaxID=321763 RepID=A0A1G9P497_9FIRM|nr:mechanosensitive ion channel domain-containing protein [Halarsenatibacter silvermanii]SDL93524.1 Mechanosensitive ion channel [Halarsenatibacter silvermanii]